MITWVSARARVTMSRVNELMRPPASVSDGSYIQTISRESA